MRVLMLTDFYPPDYIGGVEQHVQTLSRELVRRGHQVAVATTQNHKDSPTVALDEGVRVYRLAGWSRALTPLYQNPEFKFHPPVPDPGITAGLRRVIQQERPDVVHAHTWTLYSFIGLKAWSRAKLVVTAHTHALVCPTANYCHQGQVCTGPGFTKCIRCASTNYGAIQAVLQTSGLKLSSLLNRYVDQYIAVSSAVRRASIAGLGRPLRQMEVVPNFIPENITGEARGVGRPSFLPPGDDYILFVGRQYSHGQKGLQILLEAYEGLSDLVPLVVLLADEGCEPSQRFPERLTVVRKVPHEQVMAAWAHCAVGVVPSIIPEAFGIVALEAMACGKPVIASAIGGLPEVVVDGESGLLVRPGDAVALREALRALLTDPVRRAEMGKAAYQRARLFSADAVVGRIEQIYTEVLGREHYFSTPLSALPGVS
jgi:glycosyltransferase involved in cell wall biosynthesis